MKIVFWNLGYSRGIDGSVTDYIIKAHRFLYQTKVSQRRVLDQVIDCITKIQPDIFTYAEISLGSWGRSNFNQHAYLVEKLGKESICTTAASKYGNTILNLMPFHNGNANGFISHVPAEISKLYLRHSRKKLVYCLRTDKITVFTVHLPLVSADRTKQLKELADVVNATEGSVIVCGDFNILNGIDELQLLADTTDLTIPKDLQATFPAHRAQHILDVFLYRLPSDRVPPRITVLNSTVSDHLPVVLEL